MKTKQKLFFGVTSGILFISLAAAQPIAKNGQSIDQQILLQREKIQAQEQINQTDQQILMMEQQKLTLLLNSRAKQILRSQYQWMKGTLGNVPNTAVIGGQSANGAIYICQAQFFGGVHPGQLTKNGCLISYEGKALTQTDYHILMSKQGVSWQQPGMLGSFQYQKPQPWPIYGGIGPVIPRNMPQTDIQQASMLQPIIGGYEKGHFLYVCRGIYQNSIHVGKVVANNCNIAFNGLEIKLPVYEVLFQDVVEAQQSNRNGDKQIVIQQRT